MSNPLEKNELHNMYNISKFKLSVPKALVVAILIVICMQVLGSIFTIPALFWPDFFNLAFPLSFLVGGTAAIVILLPFVKTKWIVIKEHIMTPTSFAVIALSILLYLFMMPFAEFLTSAVPVEGNGWLEELYESIKNTFESLLDYKVAGFITVCILAPFFEEILFRGVLLRGLLQNGTKPILAIALSSILFGLAHLNPWQFLGAGWLGAIFGYVYYRTKSLWLCMFLHALNNTISFILMMKYGTMDESVTDTDNSMAVVIFFVLALVVGWAIYKLTEKKPGWI